MTSHLLPTDSPRLPAELTDRIIDFCHYDKRTLTNCALTHSSWLPASHFHLFNTTTFDSRHKADRVTQLQSITQENAIPLSNRQSSVLSCINIVEIRSLPSRGVTPQLGNAHNLTHAVRQLCNLENLPIPSVHVNLSRFRPGPGPGNGLTRSLLSPVNDLVTRVRLFSVTFAHINHIWPFLSSFPRLQYLELSRVNSRICSDPILPAERIFDGIPLSTLRVDTMSMGIIPGLVRVAGSLSRLDDFGIRYRGNGAGQLPDLAEAIQTRVKCLRFSLERHSCHRESARLLRPPFDNATWKLFGQFRSLDTLVLKHIAAHRCRASVGWVTGALRQLPSQIRTLVFVVIATNSSELNAIPWESIDKIVSPETPQFKELTRVQVLLKGRVRQDMDEMRPKVVGRLSGLDRLGLLRCDTARY